MTTKSLARSHIRHNQKGLTLVELLIYFGLFSILLVVINSIFISTLQVQTQQSSRSALQQEAEYVLAKLHYDLYNADSITMPANSGDVSEILTIEQDGESKTYWIDNQRLLLDDNSSSHSVTSGRIRVNSFTVQNVSATTTEQTVRFELQLETNIDDGSNPAVRVVASTVTRR